MLSARQLAQRLGCSRSMVRKAISDGLLKARKVHPTLWAIEVDQRDLALFCAKVGAFERSAPRTVGANALALANGQVAPASAQGGSASHRAMEAPQRGRHRRRCHAAKSPHHLARKRRHHFLPNLWRVT